MRRGRPRETAGRERAPCNRRLDPPARGIQLGPDRVGKSLRAVQPWALERVWEGSVELVSELYCNMGHSCNDLCGFGTYHLVEKAADSWREVHPDGRVAPGLLESAV